MGRVFKKKCSFTQGLCHSVFFEKTVTHLSWTWEIVLLPAPLPTHCTNNEPEAQSQNCLDCSASYTVACAHCFRITIMKVFISESIRPGRHPQSQSHTVIDDRVSQLSQLPVWCFFRGPSFSLWAISIMVD